MEFVLSVISYEKFFSILPGNVVILGKMTRDVCSTPSVPCHPEWLCPAAPYSDQMQKQLRHQAVSKLHIFVSYSKPNSLLEL